MELINEYELERFSESVADNVGIFFLVIVVLAVVAIGVAYAMAKTVKEDDDKPAVRSKGRVLEKYVENRDANAIFAKLNLRIEWIVIECENGNRLRLRNLPANNIQLLPGDQGEFMYRGETLYRFDRENCVSAVTGISEQKIPAWQRVETEQAEAERKAAEDAEQ